MPSITNGVVTIEPELVLGYETTQEAGNVVHEIIGRGDPDVTLRPARSRSGTLALFFLTEADAETARNSLATGDVWDLAAELTTIAMSFVVSGDIMVRLDPETRLRWLVNVGYREVTA
jgi:hypothetical protein